jgi:hypothetical protein
MLPEPMVVCTYGWGRLLRLYHDQIDIDGMFYALTRITNVQAYYRYFLGISSVRLEIRFSDDTQVLRGMPLLPETQVLVEYLTRWTVANAQRSERQHPALSQRLPLKETPLPVQGSSTLPIFDLQQTTTFRDQPQASNGPHLEIPRWMLLRKEQRERRLKRLQIERSLREHGFDVAALARRLHEEPLPHVLVPIRLLPGEHAHYSSEATLCEEPLAGAAHQRYIARDQGSLIFTNKRIIYLGRKSQLVISYARLFHISSLPGALAFLAEHWSKREVFELPRPLEAKMYLEATLKLYQTATGTVMQPRDPRAQEVYPVQFQTPRRAIEDETTQPLPVVKSVGGVEGKSASQRVDWIAGNIRPNA